MKPLNVHKTDDEQDRRSRIVKAIAAYDLRADSAWREFASLSTHAELEAIEADPEGVLMDSKGNFRGVMNVYVTLEYGTGRNQFATSESLLGKFEGHFESGTAPKIDRVTVDTTPLQH